MNDLSVRLRALGQEALAAHLEGLEAADPGAWRRLAAAIAEIDFDAIQAGLAPEDLPEVGDAEPYPWVDLEARELRDAEAELLGWEALRQGRVAAMLMAGGSGTRLGWDAPKGTYVVLPHGQRSLYEIHARKLRRMAERAGRAIPFVIMLSDDTYEPTRAFFEERAWFGLDPADVFLFTQGTLPAVDDDGNVLLAAADRLTAFPDGHGGIYRAMHRSGVMDALRDRGISEVFLFQVDNPLVPILDPAFLGYHLGKESEISFLASRKNAPEEKVGVFAISGAGRPIIVEYIALPERFVQEWRRFAAGNLAIYALSLPFMRRVAEEGLLTPHRSRKKVPAFRDGRLVNPSEPNAWKLEKLLFDALAVAARHAVVEVARERSFAPVKNASGVDSAESARGLMRARSLVLLGEAGYDVAAVPPGRPVELAPEYLVDGPALAARVAAGGLPEPTGPGPLLVELA